MPGFTLKIDTSQFHKATVEAEKDVKDLCVTLKIVPQQITEAEKAQRRYNDTMQRAGISIKALTANILALFGAYKAVQSVRGILSTGTAYSSGMEKAQLGIAAVVASTMELVDAEGKAVKGAEKFAAAQKMSVEMAKQLDIASMESPADYQDLLQTFQTLLAPANALGMNWRQTLDTTIMMSNTLSAMNIPMDRLAAETKSILTGTNLTRSAVAMNLQLTKEEVEEWQKSGKIFENLQKRLEQMGHAGKAVEKTFEATKAYMDDVLKNIQGDASKQFFSGIKEAMNAIAETFYQQKEMGDGTKQFFVADDVKELIAACDELSGMLGDSIVNAANKLRDILKFLNDNIDNIKSGVQSLSSAVGPLTAGFTAWAIVGDTKLNASLRRSIAAMKDLSAVGKSVMGFFGGPLGLGITAATVALGALVTTVTNAQAATKKHSEAQEEYSRMTAEAAKESKTLNEYLREQSDWRKRIYLQNQQEAYDLNKRALTNEIDRLREEYSGINSAYTMTGFVDGSIEKAIYDIGIKLGEANQKFQEGKIDAQAFEKELENIGSTALNLGGEGETISRKLDAVFKGLLANLKDSQKSLDETKDALKDVGASANVAASGVNNLSNALSSIDAGKLAGVLSDLQFDTYLVGLDAKQKGFANVLKKAGRTNEEIEKTITLMQGNEGGWTKEDQKLYSEYSKNYAAHQAAENAKKNARVGRGGGGSGRNTAEEAKRALASLNDEIDKLTKTDSEYRELQLQKKLAELRQQIPSAEEDIKRFEAAQRAAFEKEDAKKAQDESNKQLQTKAQLLKDLSELSGDLNMGMEAQNMLLEQQAATFKAGLNADMHQYVDKWLELSKLKVSNDPLDKMKVAWDGFYKESMDWGASLSNSATGWMNSFSDSIATMATTGKANFADLANSIVNDLVKISMRMMLVWAIGKAIGMFAGKVYDSPAAANGNLIGNPNYHLDYTGNALGGAYIGGTLSRYSNSIVARPTLFSYGARINRFARGAGLMGEAGPEAIMPLTRHNGRLGVDASGTSPKVNVIINNMAGAEIETEQRQNSDGSMDIEATIIGAVNRDLSRRGGQLNRTMRNQWGGRSIVTKR